MTGGTARDTGTTFDPYADEDAPARGPAEADEAPPVETERPGAAAEAIERATAALGDDDGAAR